MFPEFWHWGFIHIRSYGLMLAVAFLIGTWLGLREARRMGIDIGGTGIKGAPVDTRRGELVAERIRIPTPQPATPAAVADAVPARAIDTAKMRRRANRAGMGTLRRGRASGVCKRPVKQRSFRAFTRPAHESVLTSV